MTTPCYDHHKYDDGEYGEDNAEPTRETPPQTPPRRLDRGAEEDISVGAARERLRDRCLPGGGDIGYVGLPAAAA